MSPYEIEHSQAPTILSPLSVLPVFDGPHESSLSDLAPGVSGPVGQMTRQFFKLSHMERIGTIGNGDCLVHSVFECMEYVPHGTWITKVYH
jgi:hypothetical protein